MFATLRYGRAVATTPSASANSDDADARQLSAGRALASPLRLRILRFCLYDAHTNREIAEEFGLNVGTSLHHVRTLVNNGFLVAEEPRTGRRGSREIPYRATGLSWSTRIDGQGALVIRTFLEEVDGLDLDEQFMVRMGFKLTAERLEELQNRLVEVILEYHESPDDDGARHGLFLSVHPEGHRSSRTESGSE